MLYIFIYYIYLYISNKSSIHYIYYIINAYILYMHIY